MCKFIDTYAPRTRIHVIYSFEHFEKVSRCAFFFFFCFRLCFSTPHFGNNNRRKNEKRNTRRTHTFIQWTLARTLKKYQRQVEIQRRTNNRKMAFI